MNGKTKLVKRPSTVLLPERDIDKTPVLECVGLGVTFGGLKAVEDFDLTIGRTEIAGLIGPNGAGKTTVFNLLTKVYIARQSDAMLVIGGKHSSNTQKLYEICRKECENTYFIQTLDDLDLKQLQSFRSVGITAGASTPNNIIKEVQSYVRNE